MRLGASLFLIAVGAILTFAITVQHSHGFNINTVGIILMIVGGVGLLAELIYMGTRRNRNVVVQDYPAAPPAQQRYVRDY
jgi:membrane-bound ClpP family serine protease